MRRPVMMWCLAAAVALAPAASRAASCVASASALVFGLYDTVQSSANDTTATVLVTCTAGATGSLTTNYTITVAGTGSGNDSVRSISSAGNRLYYQMYKDSNRNVVWGNGSTSGAGVSSSVTSSANLLPAAQTHTVYARMPAHQTVPPGTYTGSLLVTIDY